MRFVSKHTELNVIVRPTLKDIVNNRPVTVRGIRAQFRGGVFRTDDPETIEKLLKISKRTGQFFPDIPQRELRKLQKEEAGQDEFEEENTETPKVSKKPGRPKGK